MRHRSGGKSRGRHTTTNDLSARVHDIATKISEVTGVSVGFLSGTHNNAGKHRVKIGLMTGGLLLTVRQSCTIQQLRVFGSNIALVQEKLVKALEQERIMVVFSKQGV